MAGTQRDHGEPNSPDWTASLPVLKARGRTETPPGGGEGQGLRPVVVGMASVFRRTETGTESRGAGHAESVGALVVLAEVEPYDFMLLLDPKAD